MAAATNDVSSRTSPAVDSARPRRGKCTLEPSQDKGDELQSLEIRSPSQKRKRSAYLRFLEVHDINEQQPGANEDGEEWCAFSKPKSTCEISFSWTEEADRKLVIQYVRQCATLGAKYYHQINWASLPDLPAPPSTCKRRMSYLKISNGKFRKSLMSLCNMFSTRYAKLLPKTQNSDHGTGLQEESWDDFDDKNIKEVLNKTLHYVRLAKSVASKRCASSCKEESDLNANAEDVRGSDFQPLSLSPLVFPDVVKSPFPTNSGKRAAKFSNWLHEKHRDLIERGIELPTDMQCGDMFHLFTLGS